MGTDLARRSPGRTTLGAVALLLALVGGAVAATEGADDHPTPTTVGDAMTSPATSSTPTPTAPAETPGTTPEVVPDAGPVEEATPDPVAPATAPAAGELAAALDAWLVAHADVRAVTVGVARAEADGWTWAGTAGDAGGAGAVHAPYGVLSVTKTFTAALVLREVAAGRIDLDAPVPPLPGVPAPADPPTPRMLLQHTSGLVTYDRAVGYDAAAMLAPADTVSLALHSPRLAPPGTHALYANTNFHWLGLLLEHTTGRSYGDLVAGLAAEVGLAATSVSVPARPGWVGYASGGIASTVRDLTRWGAALFTPGRVLPSDLLPLLVDVGPLGVSHGLWPVCSCGPVTTPARGVGQLTADGGMILFPASGVVVVVRFPPGVADAHRRAAEVGEQVVAVVDRHR